LFYNPVKFFFLPVLLSLGPESFFSKEKTGKKRKSISKSGNCCKAKGNGIKDGKGGGTCLCRSLLRDAGWLHDVPLNVFFDCSFDKK